MSVKSEVGAGGLSVAVTGGRAAGGGKKLKIGFSLDAVFINVNRAPVPSVITYYLAVDGASPVKRFCRRTTKDKQHGAGAAFGVKGLISAQCAAERRVGRSALRSGALMRRAKKRETAGTAATCEFARRQGRPE